MNSGRVFRFQRPHQFRSHVDGVRLSDCLVDHAAPRRETVHDVGHRPAVEAFHREGDARVRCRALDQSGVRQPADERRVRFAFLDFQASVAQDCVVADGVAEGWRALVNRRQPRFPFKRGDERLPVCEKSLSLHYLHPIS